MTTTTPPRIGVDAFRLMLTIRRFEERVMELRSRDVIAGSVHPCLGQEAVPVGAVAGLAADDRIVATYRGHGWALAAGVDPEALMAEICQRATGVNGGRGGSAYLSDPEHRFMGENSIVGGGLPVADGLALAAQLQATGRVVCVSFGDGATSQGASHEAFVMAVARRLPVIFICENNAWSEMTPTADILRGASLVDRAAAYGMEAVSVDGSDAGAVREAVAAAAARARDGRGPSFVECVVPRLSGHYNADVEHYRSDEDREAARARDPIAAARAALLEAGSDADELEAVAAEVDAEVERLTKAVLAAPNPDPATAADHVVGPTGVRSGDLEVAAVTGTALTYAKAVNEALARELEARPEAMLFGEDVGVPGGVFGVTRELHARFGPERVFDTPIAEASILGSALGAAMEGLRPIVEIMWADFLLVALDQLVNQAANVRYLSRGTRSAPLVVRCQQGVTPGSCAQHSQSLEALLAHVPGLRIGMPATPAEAFAMTRAAIADEDPCILIESRALYGRKGAVDLDAPVEAVGGARLRRAGDDVAIITWGRMLDTVLAAAEQLEAEGVQASVLDLRWLAPLDDAAIAQVVGRCSRVLICHEANLTGGFGAEVAARIADRHLFDLDAPVRRLGAPDVRFPSAPVLQDALLPDADAVTRAARDLLTN